MHFEVITEKAVYVYNSMNVALKMQHLLQSAGINCTVKCVHKARALK